MSYRFAPLNLFICDMTSCDPELRIVNPEPLKALFQAIDFGWTVDPDIVLCPNCSPPEPKDS